MIVQSQHFDEEMTNKRVVYWLLEIEASIGDDVILADYVDWVSEKLHHFKKEQNVHLETRLDEIPFGQQMFDNYLMVKIKESEKGFTKWSN